MNRVVIVFVPVGALQPDFEAALREYFAQLQIGETTPQANTTRVGVTDKDQLPLWTWFIPNPCRQPYCFNAESCAGFTKVAA